MATEAEKAANLQAYLEKTNQTLEDIKDFSSSKLSKIKNQKITGEGSGKWTRKESVGMRKNPAQIWDEFKITEPLFEEFWIKEMKDPKKDLNILPLTKSYTNEKDFSRYCDKLNGNYENPYFNKL